MKFFHPLKLLSSWGFLLTSLSCISQNTYTQYVNPFVGTGGHGHTFPGATTPFGLVQLSPDTRLEGWDGCGGYHYSDSIIYGFSHTHLSGTGIPDYCDILLMPTVGEPQLKSFVNGDYRKGYASHFSHKNEIATAGYYAVHLDDDNIDASLTTTTRAGFHKYVFPETKQANIILDLVHRDKVLDSYVKVIDPRHFEGMRRSQSWAQNEVVYFYAEFSKPADTYYIALNDSLTKDLNEAHGTNVKACFQFHSKGGEAIYVKVGISFTSAASAKRNLESECPSWDFEAVKKNAETVWNHELGKIEVSGGTAEEKKIFYTALYHTMICPNICNDVDGYYLGRDFRIHKTEDFNYYTVYSLWDTHRALHPLLSIIDQERTADFIKTFLIQYEQGGRLPVWELASNETDCMIGYHSVSVITDAAMKGIQFDYTKALEAMKHSAGLSIYGLDYYRNRGYISMEDEGESVSKTLEYAYDDWCIAQMAKLAGNSSSYQEFIERAQYWKNIFDWNRGFMRPKKNGGWHSPFDPFEVNFNYTEANAWQYNFAVSQDIEGLIRMMGGEAKFEAKLDSLFSVSSKTTGREQSDITGLIGQYAHGNEPSHHMAYLYDYISVPWKTQQRVRQILREMYHDVPDGLSGNEDCGQMSAWYVMSAMGFYEVTPGNPYYAIGSPVFDEVKIHLSNHKTFMIKALNNSPGNVYIQSMSINGKESQDHFFFDHSSIMNGDTLKFVMSSSVSKVNTDLVPKGIKADFVINPVIQSPSGSFSDSLRVTMKVFVNPNEPATTIHFTEDGSEPSIHSKKYTKPLIINESRVIKAIAIDEKKNQSRIVTASFHKTDKNWKVTYLTNYNSPYMGGGDMCLTDGQMNSVNFRDGTWQGWWGTDMEVIIDLGKETLVSKVGAEYLQDQHTWILMPVKVDFEISSDGKSFYPVASVANTLSDHEEASVTRVFSSPVKPQTARFVKITAINYGTLPAWHQGAGGKAWIFCDEVFVE